MDENNPAPKPWEEPVAPPIEEPAPTVPVEPQPVTPVPETPTPEVPSEKPKKDNKLVVILLSVVVLIAVIVGVIVVITDNNAKKSSAPTNTTTTTTTTSHSGGNDDDDEDEDDANAQKINTEIDADVAHVVTALSQYQANNRGAIPTIVINNGNEGANETKTWDYFIANYVDSQNSDGTEKFSETYQIEVCNFYEGTCKKPSDLTWAQDKYVINIATKASCSVTGEVEMNEGTRHVAVYAIKKPYSTMTNKYICKNN